MVGIASKEFVGPFAGQHRLDLLPGHRGGKVGRNRAANQINVGTFEVVDHLRQRRCEVSCREFQMKMLRTDVFGHPLGRNQVGAAGQAD